MVVIESYSLKNWLFAVVSELQIEKKKKECFILCVNMPTTGASHSKTGSSFVLGIYHDFPHSALTHRRRVWISADICVWWEALGLTGLTEATPSTHMSSNITSRFPAGFGPVSLRVGALSQSRSGRRDLIGDSTKAIKRGGKKEEADHVGRLQPSSMLRECWCQKFMTQYYKTRKILSLKNAIS